MRKAVCKMATGRRIDRYFPTYTLGNLYAAQLFDRACQDIGGLEDQIARGHFGELREWLQIKIYRHGQRYSANALVEQATGQPVDYRPFVRSLERKYRELYRV